MDIRTDGKKVTPKDPLRINAQDLKKIFKGKYLNHNSGKYSGNIPQLVFNFLKKCKPN